MKIINTFDTGTFIEDIMFAKADIERLMIEKKEIEKKQPLDVFIGNLPLGDNIFLKDNQVIPFGIVQGKEEKWMIYTYDKKSDDDETYKAFMETLEEIKFDTSRLKPKNATDLFMGENISQGIWFIIKGNVYTV